MLYMQSSFLGRVSSHSLPSSNKQKSSMVRSFIFGRDDSNSRSSVSISEDSSDAVSYFGPSTLNEIYSYNFVLLCFFLYCKLSNCSSNTTEFRVLYNYLTNVLRYMRSWNYPFSSWGSEGYYQILLHALFSNALMLCIC